MSHPLQALLVRNPTVDEALRLARIVAVSADTPFVIQTLGQLLRSTLSVKTTHFELVDRLVVVHHAAPTQGSEPASLEALQDTDMVLVGMYGIESSKSQGTFVGRPTAGRSEAETNAAVRVALAAVKGELPDDADPENGFIMYHGCPTPILDFVKAEMPLQWEDRMYDMFIAHSPSSKLGLRIGSSWVDGETGETFVIDRIRRSDFEAILAALENYTNGYLEIITQTYPFTELNCMIRAYPKGVDPTTASHEQGEPAAWASTHLDFSCGALATRDKYRRRKLAAKCVEVVTALQLELLEKHFGSLLADCSMKPLCFGMVHDANIPSIRTMEGCGFRKAEGVRFQWIGIKLSSI